MDEKIDEAAMNIIKVLFGTNEFCSKNIWK